MERIDSPYVWQRTPSEGLDDETPREIVESREESFERNDRRLTDPDLEKN